MKTRAIPSKALPIPSKVHSFWLKQRYRGLLEAAPDPTIILDDAGKIVLLNVRAEKRFGYSHNELIGHEVTDIIPFGFTERLMDDGLRSAEEALDQQMGSGAELVALCKDGAVFPVEIMLTPLQTDDDVLVTAAIRDISRRKASEAAMLRKIAELHRSNEELSQFAYIASHDLQEPLRMISSYTQLLAKRYAGRLDSDADDFIGFAVDGAERMQRLIQDLLAYSRVGTDSINLAEVSSEKALDEALINLRSAIDDCGAVVTRDALPTIRADATQLTQLFQNLVGNAIKYRRETTPHVHISARRNADDKWEFTIKDNGLGIEKQYLTRIFGMFQRLHSREEFSGTGIGLAICKKIVDRHGGNISVESTPGEGSAFHFSLGVHVDERADHDT